MNRLITQLHGLSPSDFERVVAMLLQAQGYADVQLIGGANDRGVDITCRDADGDLIAVQCKRYEPGKRIGALAIQHLTTMAFHRRVHRGMFVTTAAFTSSARQQAQEFDIELIDGQQLAGLVHANAATLDFVWSNWQQSGTQTIEASRLSASPVNIPYNVLTNHRALPAFLARFSSEQPATVEFSSGDYDDTVSSFADVMPYEFRQAVALGHISWYTDRTFNGKRTFKNVKTFLLQNPEGPIQDFLVEAKTDYGRVLRGFVRCHHVRPGAALSANDVFEFYKQWDRRE
jgi:hypothetical protein